MFYILLSPSPNTVWFLNIIVNCPFSLFLFQIKKNQLVISHIMVNGLIVWNQLSVHLKKDILALKILAFK